MCHDNEEWCKIWRGIDLSFQNWHEEPEEFWLKHSKRSYLSWHWRVIQNLVRNQLVISKLTIRNLTNFDLSTRKSENFHFNKLLLIKVYIVWTKKVQRSYVWWHWRLMENLKENWLVLSRMTWRICQICTGWNKWIGHLIKLFTHV